MLAQRKVPKKGHPHGGALRASPGRGRSDRAVPTQHPVVAGLKGPSMALSPGLHNPGHGASKGGLGILRPALNCWTSVGVGRAPLGPPWTGLWKPGKWARDGPFSPSATGRRASCSRTLGASMPQALTGAALEFGTARLEQVRPGLARRAVPWGCVLLVTFLAQARKVTRPLALAPV